MPSSIDPVINRLKAKEWRLANPDRHRNSNREWVAKKRLEQPGFEREAQKRYRTENQEARQAATTKWAREKRPGYWMFKNAQYRARKLGLPFDLVWAEIVIPEVCPVLGIPIIMGMGREGFRANSPSLDRLIPAMGYVKTNVRVISMRANWIKRDATVSELEAIVAYMKRELG